MTKREAKRRVARGAMYILESASEQLWLEDDYSEADEKRMKDAFEELLDRLAREAGMERRAKRQWADK